MQFYSTPRLGEGARILTGAFPCGCYRTIVTGDNRCFYCRRHDTYMVIDEDGPGLSVAYECNASGRVIDKQYARQFSPLIKDF